MTNLKIYPDLNSRSRGAPRSAAGVMLGCVAAMAVWPTAVVAEDAAAVRGGVQMIEEVVVTARKRTENLQDTPISITAATGRALAARQITNTQGVAEITPNLVVTQGFGASGNSSVGAYFIRGIGQIDFLLNTDPGVGLYLDGVYIARAFGSIIDLVDLERVEVLRGPQGTLFGRNTIGGAVSLVSAPPSDEFSLEGKAKAGNYDRFEARSVLNLPLSETLSAKLAVFYRHVDGYVDRITDGSRLGDDETAGVRFAARWTPSEVLKLDVAFDYSDSEGTSPPQNVVQIVETANFPGVVNGLFVGPPCVPPPGSQTNPACFNAQYEAADVFEEQGTFDSDQSTESWGLNVTAEYAVTDWLTIKSITGYRETDAIGMRDGDHTPILIQDTHDTWSHEQFSQEIQLLGTNFDDRLNWIAGAYYFTEQGENLSFVDFPVATFQSGGSVDNENFALFTQATYDITDRLALTAGVRWTDETKTFLPDQFILTDPLGLFPPGSVPGFRLVSFEENKFDISEVKPMVNLAYRWSESFMTYATFSQGFKSGGFNQRILVPVLNPRPFAPEYVDSYEIGWKWDSLSMPLRVNGAFFYTDYQDLQIQIFDGVQPVTANAASAEIKGFELELSAAPVDGLLLTAGVGYTDAEYKDLEPSVLATGVGIDNSFAQIPEWTVNAGISYQYRLANGLGSVTPRVDLVYQSGMYMDTVNTPSLRQPGYALLNAAIAYESENGNWGVTLFGRNLTDKTYLAGGFADLVDQGYAEASIGRPREWGLQLDLRY